LGQQRKKEIEAKEEDVTPGKKTGWSDSKLKNAKKQS